MLAVVYHRYGPPEVLQQADIPKPIPGKSEILIKVYATTVTIGDTIMRSLNIPVSGLQKIMSRVYLGWTKPKRSILGMEIAGVIEAIGPKVTRYQVGQEVIASTFADNFGGYAEYKCLSGKSVIATKPENLTFEEAVAVPGAGMTALRCLNKGQIQPGQEVLIYGASGAVGTNAVQIASRELGANVTAVCSTKNLTLAKDLGASAVLDYTKPGFHLPDQSFDVVFDAVGKLSPALAKQALKPGGKYLNVRVDSNGGESMETLQKLKTLVEAGKLKPVIDRVYRFDQIIEAHRYVEKGHKRGNVVIRVVENEGEKNENVI